MVELQEPAAFVFDAGETLLGFPVASWEAVDRESCEALLRAAQGCLSPLPSLEACLSVFREVVEEAYREAAPRLEEVPARRCLERTLARLGCRELSPDELDRIERAWSEPRFAVRQVFPDVVPVLSELKGQGFRLGLVSNIWLDGRLVREHLAVLGLAPWFDSVVLSSEVGKVKPHPEPFQRCLKELGVRPARAWFVGDNPYADVAGAAGVGMHPILIRRPPYPGRVEPPETPYDGPAPEMVIESLEPLLELARRLAS